MSDPTVVSDLRRPPAMDRLRKKKATTKRVPVLLDPELADELAAAKGEFDVARIRWENAPDNSARADEYGAAKLRYDAILDATRSEVVTFVFRGVGRRAWEELVDNHRPTKDQQDKHRRSNPKAGPLEWNPDSFPVAAVAASIAEPALTDTEIREIWDDPDWNDAELATLFFAAIEVNQQRKVVDLPA